MKREKWERRRYVQYIHDSHPSRPHHPSSLPSPLSPLPYLCTSSAPSTFPRQTPNPTIRNATPNNPSQPAPISRPSQPPRNLTLSCTLPQTNRTTSSAATVNEARAWSSTQALPESHLPIFHIIPKPNAPPAFPFPSKTRARQISTFPLLEVKKKKKKYR